MRPKLALIALGCCFLLLMGIRVDGLPFFRGDARYSDSVTAHWPNALFLRPSVLENHIFPVWRETTMAGQPFAANPLNKTAYPFQWLVLFLPPIIHLNVLIVLHMFIAGAGMWKWASSLGLRKESLVLSSVAFTFAPRMIAHLGAGHLDVVYAMAWMPWLMWSVRQLIKQRIGKKLVIQAALSAALLFLGDIRVSLFAFVMASIYAAIEMGNARSWKRVSLLATSALIFCILVASLIIPLLLWMPYTSRSDLTPTDAGVLSIAPVQLLGLILPSQPTGVETLTYFGLPVLALAVVAAFTMDHRSRLSGLVIVLLIVLYAMGSNSFLWSALAQVVPGLSWFRVPSRVWLVLALLVPLCAGYGLQWVLDYLEAARSQNRPFIKGQIRLVIVACTAVVIILGFFALLALPLPKLVGYITIFEGLGLGIVLLAALSGRITSQTLAALMLIFTLIDLGAFASRWVEWRGTERWLEPQQVLAERLVEANTARIYSPTYSLEQQVAEAYHLRLFGGVDPFQLKGIVAAIEQGSGVLSGGYSVIQPPIPGVKGDDLSDANREATINTDVLAHWDVSHVIAAYPIANDRLELVDRVSGIYIYSNLDYTPVSQVGVIPNWPSDWPGLPDSVTVERLNQITIVAWVISMTGFLLCSAMLLFWWTRVQRD
jgi:hypothetical protein